MRPSGGNSHLRKRGPAPLRAGSSLLVHDLKNLASRLSNLGQNLNHRYEDPLFKQSALDLLDDTAHHLQRLAGDLREHEGRLMVKLRTDLNQVLADSLSDARPDLRPEVEVVTKYTPLEPIWGDAYLLRRAFACAIENALEAMARGPGTLSLRTSLRLRGGEKHPTVEIADTGEGMDREFVRNWLFRPFATTKEDGLGLGAYTMRQVARIHGGSLKVRSKPASGTVVSFVFSSEESA